MRGLLLFSGHFQNMIQKGEEKKKQKEEETIKSVFLFRSPFFMATRIQTTLQSASSFDPLSSFCGHNKWRDAFWSSSSFAGPPFFFMSRCPRASQTDDKKMCKKKQMVKKTLTLPSIPFKIDENK